MSYRLEPMAKAYNERTGGPLLYIHPRATLGHQSTYHMYEKNTWLKK